MLQFKIFRIPVQLSFSHLLILFAITTNIPPLLFKSSDKPISMYELSSERQLQYLALTFILVIFSLFLHELAHAFSAKFFGGDPRIIFYEIGGTTQTNIPNETSLFKKITVQLAGPFLSLCLIISSVISLQMLGISADLIPAQQNNTQLLIIICRQLLAMNSLIFVIEILPILPLDGGHILHLLLYKFKKKKALYYTFILSIIAALIFAALGILLKINLFLILFPLALALRAFLLLKRQKDVVLDSHLIEEMQESWDDYYQKEFKIALDSAIKTYENAHSELIKMQSLVLINWSALALRKKSTFLKYYAYFADDSSAPFGQAAAYAFIKKNFETCYELLGQKPLENALDTLKSYHWISAALSRSPHAEQLHSAYQEILLEEDYHCVIPFLLHNGYQMKAQSLSETATQDHEAPFFQLYRAIALYQQKENLAAKSCLDQLQSLNITAELGKHKKLLALFIIPEFKVISQHPLLIELKEHIEEKLKLIDFKSST